MCFEKSSIKFFTMHKQRLSLFLLLIAATLSAQTRIISDAQTGKKGILSWAGDTILPCQYFVVSHEGGGRFLVAADELNIGLVDEQGRFLIPISEGMLYRLGDQPGDAFFKRTSKLPNTGTVFDTNGKLLLSDCQPGIVYAEPGFKGIVPDQRPNRYFTAGVGHVRKFGFFRADGRQIVPLKYENLSYCSDTHPIRAYADKRYAALDFNGKEVLPARFSELKFTKNPRVMYGRPDTSELWGFISLDKPQTARFEYKSIRQVSSFFYIVNKGADYFLHNSDGKRINPEAFAVISSPLPYQHKTFREKSRGLLIACGLRKSVGRSDGSWVGFDEQGKAWDFAPPPPSKTPEPVGVDMQRTEEVPSMEELRPMKMQRAVEVPGMEELRPSDKAKPASDEIFQIPEKQPAFPGGETALSKYWADNLKYPAIAKENGVQGKVVVRFIVEKDGSLTEIQILRDLGGGCGKEAVRLVQAMPKWIPGEQGGQIVRVKYTLPVPFKL